MQTRSEHGSLAVEAGLNLEVGRWQVGALAWVVALSALVVLVNLPALLGPSAVDGPDARIHFRWAWQFLAALNEGVAYPRWAAYANQGLGDPSFLYIHPLFYYATALASPSGDIWSAMARVIVATEIASAALLFTVLRSMTSSRIAGLTALVFVLSPYFFHLAHYQQFLPMPFASASVLALLMVVLGEWRSSTRISLTAIATAVACLSHILAAFLALLLAAPAMLLRARRQRAWGTLVAHSAGVLLGLALAGAYVLPALTSQSLITPDAWFQPRWLDWRNAFLFQAITLPDFGYRWFHLQWTIALVTLIAASLAAGILVATRRFRGVEWHRALLWTVTAFAGLALGSEPAWPLWEAGATLQRVQFPLRVLQVSTLASLVALALASWAARRSGRIVLSTAPLFVMLAISAGLLATMERKFLDERRPAFELAHAAVAMRGQDETKPATTGPDRESWARAGGFQAECARAGVACSTELDLTHARTWRVIAAHGPQLLRLPLLAFPGWQVAVNGAPAGTRIDGATGLAAVELGPGTNVVSARWIGVAAEASGAALTAIAVPLLLLVMLLPELWRAGVPSARVPPRNA